MVIHSLFINDFSVAKRIRRLAKKLEACTDDELCKKGLSLKYRATTGAQINELIPQAFALVSESARRSVNMVPYNVQLFGGIQIARGHVAEMKTGEGKTLTATLPTFVHALYDRGAHVVTVNDYLAKRDFEIMGPVYARLGLSVGVIQADDTPEQRQAAYRKDVTYGTAKEFGFDFLRDRMKLAGSSSRISTQNDLVMRGLHFVLVDEADSVLIDEARTPLIIGIINAEEEQKKQDCFRWAAKHADQFEKDVDYEYDHDRRKVTLENAGIERLRRLPQTSFTRQVPIRQLYEYMENAIKVKRDFQLDEHYIIRDGKVAIVDEFTGRVAEGRQWQAGIHQSVEAKEDLEISPATGQGATITLQTFFRRYDYFGGMTGTVWTSRAEFKKVYKKKVVRVPTNRPTIRKQLATKIYPSQDQKITAVVEETKAMIASGRAVLIGTRTVDKSEMLSRVLNEFEIKHQVLNANNHELEAEIVADSGNPGRVTVATNMAGRGTDIILEDSVRKAGGLHVILTEIHESQRIDWQLIGRGSRQGDPGSFRIFLAMDDEVLKSGLGPKKSSSLARSFVSTTTQPDSSARNVKPRLLPRHLFRHFTQAQQKLERKHLIDRMILLKQDKERQERHFEMGQDPFCDVVQS
ncbi:MAG: preprotein translocase subunit SecA [Mariniblastus sp.]